LDSSLKAVHHRAAPVSEGKNAGMLRVRKRARLTPLYQNNSETGHTSDQSTDEVWPRWRAAGAQARSVTAARQAGSVR